VPDHGTVGDFHVYALEWEPGEIRWSVDGKDYQAQSFWWSSSKTSGGKGVKPTQEADLNPWPAPFDQRFFLIVNVAIGKFPGNPEKTTVFPMEMLIDYMRVYDKVGGYEKTKPRGEGKLPLSKR
jgi:beta-glucanase (GH16 family)